MKWYQVIFTLLIGAGIALLLSSYWPEPDHSDIEDPQIHHLKEEIGWRDFREARRIERIKKDSIEKIALAKDVIKYKTKSDQSDAELRKHRKEAHPLTTRDTISFLMEDTTLCDKALNDLKRLAAGLTKEVKKDSVSIKRLDSLNNDLKADKNDLLKVDSLHIQKEKKLTKSGRKKFLRGLGIGGVLGFIVALLL